MARCVGTKRDGIPCSLPATSGSTRCWAHDPANAEQRTKIATKAGRAKGPGGEIIDIKQHLKKWMTGVVEGKFDKSKVAVAATVGGVMVRCIEAERRIKEQEDLIARIEELEQMERDRSLGEQRFYG